jgi:hypothetical protein
VFPGTVCVVGGGRDASRNEPQFSMAGKVGYLAIVPPGRR